MTAADVRPAAAQSPPRQSPADRAAGTGDGNPAFHRCTGCGALVYLPRLERSLGVCPDCGRHGQVTAQDRIGQLTDPGSPRRFGPVPGITDPLGFVDTIPYPRRIEQARAETGLDEAVLCVRAAIDSVPVVLAVMDFRFLGGSLGSWAGEMITGAAETALADRCPLVLVTASGGARMQEGAFALMQMAKTAQAMERLDAAGLLTVTVVTDPTFGGVAASFATLADVIIAEPGARLGFAGPRVIARTIGGRLPPRFQTAEFLREHGVVDMVRPRGELRATLARLFAATGYPDPARVPDQRRGSSPARPDGPIVTDPAALPCPDAWDLVRRARDLGRPTTLDYIRLLLTDFEELGGDRLGADDPAIVGGVGLLDDIPVMVIGHQKGHNVAELTARRFGMSTPAGYRKAGRLMRLAAKLGLGVVTLIDTPGAYPGAEAEEQGQSVAIAESLRLMAGLPIPTVAVVTGEGGSGGALALGLADQVLICENATYSVISPEGCAAILWNDPATAPRAAAALRPDPRALLSSGVVDGVVPEPAGGAQHDPVDAARLLGAAVTRTLRPLLDVPVPMLLERRRARFRSFGPLRRALEST